MLQKNDFLPRGQKCPLSCTGSKLSPSACCVYHLVLGCFLARRRQEFDLLQPGRSNQFSVTHLHKRQVYVVVCFYLFDAFCSWLLILGKDAFPALSFTQIIVWHVTQENRHHQVVSLPSLSLEGAEPSLLSLPNYHQTAGAADHSFGTCSCKWQGVKALVFDLLIYLLKHLKHIPAPVPQCLGHWRPQFYYSINIKALLLPVSNLHSITLPLLSQQSLRVCIVNSQRDYNSYRNLLLQQTHQGQCTWSLPSFFPIKTSPTCSSK